MSNMATLSMAVPQSPPAQSDIVHASLKRQDLNAQLSTLRSQLKDWEKSFAATHLGQKPGRQDIKSDGYVSKLYKEYNRIRDVVEGKAPAEKKTHKDQPDRRSSSKRKEQEAPLRKDSYIRGRDSVISTPQKKSTFAPYDHPQSVTPRPLKAFIGPTPQRDGKILGLFDMLPTNSSNATPTTDRKRKADALTEGDVNLVQTPSRKRTGDILDFLQSDDAPYTGRRQRFERTPASEGKKILLSQFFATPNTARFMDENHDYGMGSKTPLRTKLLAGRESPRMAMPDVTATDSTPPFLRRTSSFNQRLLAESNQPISFPSPDKVRRGPSRLSLFKKGRSLSEIVKDLRKTQDEEHDDDLDALHDMEAADSDVQVEDSQAVEEQDNGRSWKKRGQKRTTKRTNMKPPTAKSKSKPPTDTPSADVETEDDLDPSDDHDGENAIGKPLKGASTAVGHTRKTKPNAVSHMNFRSLKIKNKNSKAKGRGRFGRR